MSNAPYVGIGFSQGSPSPEAANVATFITPMIQAGASANSDALGAVPQAHDQICSDAASFSV